MYTVRSGGSWARRGLFVGCSEGMENGKGKL